jgi:hypothetical protein
MYTEAIGCESAKLWLAALFMIEKTLEAILIDINEKLTTKLTKLTFFLALKEQDIISEDIYNWAERMRIVKNWNNPVILSNTTREEVSETLDFLQIVMDIIYNPSVKSTY